jgi:hypothetical protein
MSFCCYGCGSCIYTEENENIRCSICEEHFHRQCVSEEGEDGMLCNICGVLCTHCNMIIRKDKHSEHVCEQDN